MSIELATSAVDTVPITPPKDSDVDGFGKAVAVKSDTAGLNPTQEEGLADKAEREEKNKLSSVQLEKVAEQLQVFMDKMNRGLQFSVDQDSGRDVIKVLDKKSGELIKQYPTEEVLSLVAKLSEATGSFIDSKV